MSIKLSIKDLKDLLKIQNKQIKKRMPRQRRAALQSGRRKNKRIIKTTNDNYNKSSSDHMKSIGFTNTSNEATELIRLQRQALEDKLKTDKEKTEKEKEMGSQIVPFGNNSGGSNNLRDLNKRVNQITNNLNYNNFISGYGELVMPAHGKPSNDVNNAYTQPVADFDSTPDINFRDIPTDHAFAIDIGDYDEDVEEPAGFFDGLKKAVGMHTSQKSTNAKQKEIDENKMYAASQHLKDSGEPEVAPINKKQEAANKRFNYITTTPINEIDLNDLSLNELKTWLNHHKNEAKPYNNKLKTTLLQTAKIYQQQQIEN